MIPSGQTSSGQNVFNISVYAQMWPAELMLFQSASAVNMLNRMVNMINNIL